MNNENYEKTDADSAQLQQLGYTSKFDRSMSLWENFSLGFTYLSPVVGVYSVFALALVSGGPPMVWNYVLIGLGQFLVCLVFGEVVSQFPISGGIYPWTRRLVGKRWAWMAGWIYLWALCTTIAAVAVGGAPYLANLLNFTDTHAMEIALALGMVFLTTCLNVSGTRLLARVAMTGFICELVGAIVVGSYLLLFARHQSVSILFQTFHVEGSKSYFSAFVASSVAAMFCYYGFEACGDVAEETPNPGIAIPRAMRMTIYIGGAAAIFVTLALMLSIPNMPAALSGSDQDPVITTLRNALSPLAVRGVISVVLISFFSCLLSLQAATSRLLFAYGRDGMIAGSDHLNKLSERAKMPVNALLVAGIVPALIVVGGYFLQNTVQTIVTFGAAGIYVAFQMVVVGALFARIKGWEPAGEFRLGRWGLTTNILALTYGLSAIVVMVWPRSPSDPWYLNYGMILTTFIVIILGTSYMVILRPYEKGTALSGDAHLLSKTAKAEPPALK